MKEYIWKEDLGLSDVSEQYILENYLQLMYPLAEKKEGYNKEYDYVVPELNCTIELKTDIESNNTGNFFIEYECNKKPSGILTTTAKFWLISDGYCIFQFEYDTLMGFYNNRITDDNPRGKYKIASCESDNPSLGVLTPQPYNNYFDNIVFEIPIESDGHYKYLNTLRNNSK